MTVLKKKVLFTFIFVLLLLAALFTTVTLVNVDAMSNNSYAKYKYFTSYEIKPGDTLTSIAEEYTANTQVSTAEYIKELKHNNKLTSDNITAGKNIIVSYYSDEYK